METEKLLSLLKFGSIISCIPAIVAMVVAAIMAIQSPPQDLKSKIAMLEHPPEPVPQRRIVSRKIPDADYQKMKLLFDDSPRHPGWISTDILEKEGETK